MSIELDITQRIAAPPERVFEALTDVDAFRDWLPGVVSIERVGDVAHGVGARFRETRRMFGRDATEEFEVTAYDPPRAFSLFVDGSKGASRRGEYRFDHQLTPDGEGTLLRVHGEIRGLPKVLGWLGKLMAAPMKKMLAKDLAALAEHVERKQPAAV